MRDLTDDVALMRPVIDALRASGCDPDRVLVRVGLPPGGLPAGRFPHSAQNLFWKAAADECGEEHVGLHLAEHLPAFHGLLLEYLFLSSDTFGAGLRHSLRYVRLLSDTLQAQLEVEGERAVLSLGESPAINRHFPEMLAGAVIRLFGALTEGEFKPLEVQLMNETGAPMERYRAVYGCPNTETQELIDIFTAKGLSEVSARRVALQLMNDGRGALDTLSREALGIDPTELGGNPWNAAGTSFLLFSLGALVPVAPFLFLDGAAALVASLLSSLLALLFSGAVTARFTGRPLAFSALRQVLVGTLAAAFTYGLGTALGVGLG
ncbi:AraC family transcriptional regulator ligand-binding domain-containing protein [Pseudomonas aeruginosa]|nr:AraC family transcriptional regulator ligand-binding domain-containing protein [Pseudomonas aeruginosa]